jgi:hypothetical protein
MAKKKAAKKKPKRKVMMKFYNLRLTEYDLEHLRWTLSVDCEVQQDLMKSGHPASATADEKLEDFVTARDLYSMSHRVIQMIDRVCPNLAKEASDG